MNIPARSFQGKNIKDWMIATVLPRWLEACSTDYQKGMRTVTEREFQTMRGLAVRCVFPTTMPFSKANKLLAEVYRDFVNPLKTHQPTAEDEAQLNELVKVAKDLPREELRKRALANYYQTMAGRWETLKTQRDKEAHLKRAKNHPKRHHPKKKIPPSITKFLKDFTRRYKQENPKYSGDEYRDALDTEFMYEKESHPRWPDLSLDQLVRLSRSRKK